MGSTECKFAILNVGKTKTAHEFLINCSDNTSISALMTRITIIRRIRIPTKID